MHAYRSHTCAELRAADAGAEARLSGWVHRKRDHGGVLFVDLRDHYGLTQVVANVGSPAFEVLDKLRVESVVTVTGAVVARDAAAVNPKMVTGEIEVKAAEVIVQSAANELPLPVAGEASIRKTSASSTASSTCGASGCTRTSCCAPASSRACAAA